MADKPTMVSKRFMRKDLETFLKTPRQIKEFDALSKDVVETIPEAIAGIGEDADTILASATFQRRPQPLPTEPDSTAAVFAGAMFQQRPPQAPPVTEDASQRILASQIFGA